MSSIHPHEVVKALNAALLSSAARLLPCATHRTSPSLKLAHESTLETPNVERCFERLEGFLSNYEVDSSSKAAKQIAKDHVQWIWQRDQEMRRFMEELLAPKYFVEVADKSLDYDGNNNFTA